MKNHGSTVIADEAEAKEMIKMEPLEAEELVRHIDSIGYNMYWHLPYYFSPNNFFGNTNNVFPNTVSVNMICVHKSIPQNMSNFEPVKLEQPQPAFLQAPAQPPLG